MSGFDNLNSQITEISDPELKSLLSNLRLSQQGESDLSSDSIVVSEDLKMSHIIELTSKTQASNFICPKSPCAIYNLSLTATLLKNPERLLDSPMGCIESIAELLRPQSKIRHLTADLRSTQDKERILNDLNTFVSRNQHLQTHVLRSVIIADEFMTNALLHGPRDPGGTRIFSRQQLSSGFSFPAELPSAKFFAVDIENSLFLGCSDPFGTLTRDTLLEKLRKCFVIQQQIDWNMFSGEQSGGLGLKMAVENSAGIMIGVKELSCSLFMCCIPVGQSGVDLELLPKSVSLGFVKENC